MAAVGIMLTCGGYTIALAVDFDARILGWGHLNWGSTETTVLKMYPDAQRLQYPKQAARTPSLEIERLQVDGLFYHVSFYFETTGLATVMMVPNDSMTLEDAVSVGELLASRFGGSATHTTSDGIDSIIYWAHGTYGIVHFKYMARKGSTSQAYVKYDHRVPSSPP